jgi:hypothetical protein
MVSFNIGVPNIFLLASLANVYLFPTFKTAVPLWEGILEYPTPQPFRRLWGRWERRGKERWKAKKNRPKHKSCLCPWFTGGSRNLVWGRQISTSLPSLPTHPPSPGPSPAHPTLPLPALKMLTHTFVVITFNNTLIGIYSLLK